MGFVYDLRRYVDTRYDTCVRRGVCRRVFCLPILGSIIRVTIPGLVVACAKRRVSGVATAASPI